MFYSSQVPDLKVNDRIHDLMTTYNINLKDLLSNLNDYEKLTNVSFLLDNSQAKTSLQVHPAQKLETLPEED